MDSYSNTPDCFINILNSKTAVENINSINMIDFWRELQLWSMSCKAVVEYGDKEPPQQLVDTRYIKESDSPESYSILNTYNAYDGEWYQYYYKRGKVFTKPLDDGEVFYDELDDNSVNKFQIYYKWDGSDFKRSSKLVGNFTYPNDNGTIRYSFNKNKTVTKQSKKYIFDGRKFNAFYENINTFYPPADDGQLGCDGQKTTLIEYDFETKTEQWVKTKNILGYISGQCGFFGYTALGTSLSSGWKLESNGNEIYLYNQALTDDLLADGLIPHTAKSQKIVIQILESGSFYVSGDFNMGFGYNVKISSEKNSLYFSDNKYNAVSMSRRGSVSGEIEKVINYNHTINGTQHKVLSMSIKSVDSGKLAILVNDGSSYGYTGEITIST